MTDVQSFLVAAGQGNGSAILALDSDRQGITSRSGRAARWLARTRSSENRALAERFVDALVERYGEDPTTAAAAATDLGRTRARGTPLRARQVREAIRQAESFQKTFADVNGQWADRIQAAGITSSCGTSRVPLLKVRIDAMARSRYRENSSVSNLVEPDVVALKAQDAITAKSRGGRHLVSTTEAAEVLAEVVTDEFESAYLPLRNYARRALLLTQGSIACEAFERAAAEYDPPLGVRLEQLTPDAAEDLSNRLNTGIQTGRIPADRLGDAAALNEFAHAEAKRFLAERVRARAAVARLDLPGEAGRSARPALLSLATCDNVPVQLVPALGRAYRSVREDIACLAGTSQPMEVANSVRKIQCAISDAFLEAGIPIEVENQNRMFDHAWRFLLAPGGEEQAAAIFGRLAPANSLLRGITEGVSNYRFLFPGTGEWNRTYQGVYPALNGRRIHDMESVATAAVYSTLMLSLYKVLDQTLVGGMKVEEPDFNRLPGDGAVAALRNWGIPFPAPNRVGETNNHVPVSDTHAAAIDAELRSYLNRGTNETPDESGLAKAHLDDLKTDHERYLEQVRSLGSGRVVNRYYIDSDQCLPQSPAAVIEALRNFCVDREGEGAGTVNGEMLHKVSAMATQDTIDCVHRGCMDPNRPDLAIMNGDLQCVVDCVDYRLSRGGNGEIRLQVMQHLRPLWYLPVDKDTDIAALGSEQDAATNRIALSPTKSHFRTTVEMRFAARAPEPIIDNIDIGYCLVEGAHDESEFPYFIPNPGA